MHAIWAWMEHLVHLGLVLPSQTACQEKVCYASHHQAHAILAWHRLFHYFRWQSQSENFHLPKKQCEPAQQELQDRASQMLSSVALWRGSVVRLYWKAHLPAAGAQKKCEGRHWSLKSFRWPCKWGYPWLNRPCPRICLLPSAAGRWHVTSTNNLDVWSYPVS